MPPAIRKARAVAGANLVLRDIEEQDAQFVFDLRTDPVKSRHLSATSGRVEDQVEWIRGYRDKTDQAYFIVCDKDGNRLGCIRMYDPVDHRYSWGSWLMVNGLSPLVSMESALLIYAYGRWLGFDEARIDVRQDNQSVWRFHEKFSRAELVSETEIERVYVVGKDGIAAMLRKYANLLTDPLKVEGT